MAPILRFNFDTNEKKRISAAFVCVTWSAAERFSDASSNNNLDERSPFTIESIIAETGNLFIYNLNFQRGKTQMMILLIVATVVEDLNLVKNSIAIHVGGQWIIICWFFLKKLLISV